MRFHPRIGLAAGLAVIALLAGACASNSDTGGSGGKADEHGTADLKAARALVSKLSIPEVEGKASDLYVFLPKSLNNPYWDDAREGMEAMAERLGVKAEFRGPQKTDVNRQVQIFESVLSRHPKGIAVSPNDPNSLKSVIAKARSQGIKVIAWDSPVPGSKVLGYIGTDNEKAGETLGRNVLKRIGHSGKVAVIAGGLGSPNTQQRLSGLKKALAKAPGIEIVATEDSHDSLAAATNKAEAILQAHPKVEAIIGINAGDAPGAATALQQAEECGKVTIAGFDAIKQSRDMMRAGCIQLLVSQRPYGMTAAALQLLVALDAGKTMPSTELDTGVVVVTPDTLDDFEKTTA